MLTNLLIVPVLYSPDRSSQIPLALARSALSRSVALMHRYVPLWPHTFHPLMAILRCFLCDIFQQEMEEISQLIVSGLKSAYSSIV
jgi:hypothetical protein